MNVIMRPFAVLMIIIALMFFGSISFASEREFWFNLDSNERGEGGEEIASGDLCKRLGGLKSTLRKEKEDV
jgi:hypothetical protein